MDALRLIKTTRRALAEARTVPGVLSEAWQGAALTQALAERICGHPVGEVADVARLLARAGRHAVGLLEAAADPVEPAGQAAASRADRLSRVGELGPPLEQLRLLLVETAEALIAIAGSSDSVAQGAYWLAIDGLDASAECRSLVIELLRVLRRLAHEDGPVVDGEPDGDRRAGTGPRAAPSPGPVGPPSGRSLGRVPRRVPMGVPIGRLEGPPGDESAAEEEPPTGGALTGEAEAGPGGDDPGGDEPASGEPAAGDRGGGSADDEPRLVITLAPPPTRPTPPAAGYRSPTRRSQGASAEPGRSAARAPEGSRAAAKSAFCAPRAEPRAGPGSAPWPARSARSALTEARSSCSWSSRLLATGAGAVGCGAGDGVPPAEGRGGRLVPGLGHEGTLQLGSAI